MDSKKKNKYWMSLEQWRDDQTFQKIAQNEFITEPVVPETGSFDRREFLKLMGASLALTSLGCLRRPTEKIVPYVDRPEGIIPGKSVPYASSYYDGGGEGFGLIVQTREGRPIKVEGNPLHPSNQGGMSARAHSHLLSLYDPDRLKTARKNLFNKEKTNKETVTAYFDEADPHIVSYLEKGKTAFLTDHFPSPLTHQLIQDFSKIYPSSHYVWDPTGLEEEAQNYKKCFGGAALIPEYHFDKARLIVSINNDFLGTFLSPTQHLKKFSVSRNPNKKMSRLVVFESLMSLTGTNADERFPILPSDHAAVLMIMVDEILSKKGSYPSIKRWLASQRSQFQDLKQEKEIRKIAKDLLKFEGQSIVLSGGFSSKTKDFESVLTLTHFLNHILKNEGSTITTQHHHRAWSQSLLSLETLIQDLKNKKIQNVIIHRSHPLYSYPDSSKFKEALREASLVISTGDRMDETSEVSDYIIPDLHDLEKWMLWEFQKNIFTIGQPTIRPLIQSRSFEDSLLTWIRASRKSSPKHQASWYQYLRHHSAQSLNLSWNTLLQKGFQKKPSAYPKSLPFKISSLKKIQISKSRHPKSQLVLYFTQGLKEGKLANVSWLQEFPDPVTKICWDNYVCISPTDAELQNLSEGQIVQIQNTSIKAPVHIQPGQKDSVVGLALGYGQKGVGKVGDFVGSNAYPLMKIINNQKIFSSIPVQIQATSQRVSLATVQDHHSMEGRQIVVETTLKKYLNNQASGLHKHKIFSLWSQHKYPREKWGMVIDLNSCTGCGACITACQSENNIPVVGKKYVLQGREMHWMRVDRYYTGDPKNPDGVVHQPVLCMHCDHAPCETVCPVAATVHSDEGTNDMIYNRCVGTRYCSNNCPYKVRRFNWFNYTKKIQTPLNGALNPEVSVRSRGVMEKCTFCIHRIRSKQSDSRLKDQKLKDGDIQTACEQSCPSNAIVFGNLNDKTSRVRQAFEKENAYALLEEVNTQPAVRYRTKIRNHDKKINHRSSSGETQ